jgi:glyoxylase-like metal-dependent hydrolase (beta-lactamase superfamily II)
MAIGDVESVDTGDCTDLHCVDTGMYDVAGYGSVYLLDGERPALVDSGIGADRERVFALLDAAGVGRDELAVIALTHVHLDHAGGAGFVAAECPNAEVVVHERGAPHVVDPSRLVEGTRRVVGEQWRYYADPEPVPGERVRSVTGGDRIDLGEHALVVHEAFGHAPHQVVFEDPENDAVFTGDSAGLYVPALDAVVPTSPPPQFDYPQALADLHTLARIEPSTLLYAHFGPAPAAGRLDEYAHTLAEWVTDVAETRTLERATDENGDVAERVVERFAAGSAYEEAWGRRKARAETALNARGVLAYLDRREERGADED